MIELELKNGILQDWANFLSKKDLSPKSIKEYLRDVSQFIIWLQNTGGGFSKSANIGMATARKYRDFLLDEKNHKASTVNRKIQSLVAYLSYQGLPEIDNPFHKLKTIKAVRSSPKSLSRSDWNAVRRAAENYSEKDKGLCLAIVSMLRHAGLRVGELVALKLSDIEIREKSGKVLIRKGKGLKERVVPLNLDAREGLDKWLKSRDKVLLDMEVRYMKNAKKVPQWISSDFLFIGQRGILTTRGVSFITEKLGQIANLDDVLGPHRFRHTFAREQHLILLVTGLKESQFLCQHLKTCLDMHGLKPLPFTLNLNTRITLVFLKKREMNNECF